MTIIKYTQSNFTAGELDPKVYTRFDYDGYLKGCKTLRNFTPIPQGGFTVRFGQEYVDTITETDYRKAQIDPLIYNDNAIYLLLWETDNLTIYLENVAIATVASTGYLAEDIINIYPTQLTNRLITTDVNHQPKILIRGSDAPNVVTGFSAPNDTLTLTANLATSGVYPAEFISTMTLPTTSPQIFINREYFVKLFSASHIRIYSTAADAKAGTNFYQITSAGTGTVSLITHNNWSLNPYPIDTFPTIDISTTDTDPGTGAPIDYGTFKFTLSAMTGTGVTVTSDTDIFDATMVGGCFVWDGGVLRFDTFTSTKIMTGTVEETFAATGPIAGIYVNVERPVWSDSLGWPRACSVYQNRVVFAGSYTFPNGVWISSTDDFANFNDTDATDDASAISFYPADGSMSFIRAITSAKTLILHTNTGNFSSAVGTDTPITPRNFTLTQQNRDGISDIIPVFTDNQIIYVDKSGNNVKNMVFDLVQGIFTLDNISLANSHLVKRPFDMDSFSQPTRTDGNFVLFLNDDGSMANLLTLKAQEIAGWSLYNTNQTDSAGAYRQTACAIDQAWFLIERTVPVAGGPVAIVDAFLDTDQFVTGGHTMPVGTPTYVQITTSSSLCMTVPQIVENAYYWCLPNNATSFQLFPSLADAQAQTNVIDILSVVTPALGMSVVPQTMTIKLMIEEANFEVNTDSTTVYTNLNSDTLTGLSHLEGETVQVVGDGNLYADLQVRGGQVVISDTVVNAYVGLNFNCTFEPLEINTPLGAYGNTFYTPKQIKKLYIQFYQTIEGMINIGTLDSPIVGSMIIGSSPLPHDGVYMYDTMQGWDSQILMITQNKPLPMTILGLGYILEDG